MPKESYIREYIDLRSVVDVVTDKKFHLIFTYRDTGADPDKFSIYKYGKYYGLGDVEASILSYMYHCTLVKSCSCYLKSHTLKECWKIQFEHNEIFNGNGIRLHKLEREKVNHTLLLMTLKKPNNRSTPEYKELYSKLYSRTHNG